MKLALLVFVIAITARGLVSVVQVAYGVHGLPFLPLSTWDDFYQGYVTWLGYLQHGLLPYRDFYAYKYTPLFLYSLYPFFLAGGAQLAALPIVLSDAATAAVVYLIVNRLVPTKIAFAAGLVYAFSPFVLYYEDYLWLSSQPMTLFILLAVYLFAEKRPSLSFASLAVAVMFKQEALFVLPAYLAIYARGYGRETLKGVVIFVAVLAVVSLPFLVAAPRAYLASINYYQVISFGPPEQSLPAAAAMTQTLTPSPNPLGGCGMTTLPSLFTGTLCGSIVNMQEFAQSLVLGRINQIGFFVAPFLLALSASAALMIRKAPSFLQTMCTYSYLGSAIVFAGLVEPYIGYYFVPVYAMILSSVTDLRTLAVGVGATVLSLTLLEGPFQVILPLASLFLITVLQLRALADKSRTRYEGLLA